jgi:hypothetical protein
MRIFTVLLLAFAGACALVADEKTDAARQAAESWLALVDAGKYGESWDHAAAYFKANVPKEKWEQMMTGARKPLGAAKSRDLATATYTKQLPGAPDGEYVVIQFNSSFENKKTALETVTPTMDKDGKWRVSGYFIK